MTILKHLNLTGQKAEASFNQDITILLRPFLGFMSVAPKLGKKTAAIPDYVSGNMDKKELFADTILYLPVLAKGGLFSTGDAHAVHEDGEVNVTAIETAMEEAVLRSIECNDMKLERPMAENATH